MEKDKLDHLFYLYLTRQGYPRISGKVEAALLEFLRDAWLDGYRTALGLSYDFQFPEDVYET